MNEHPRFCSSSPSPFAPMRILRGAHVVVSLVLASAFGAAGAAEPETIASGLNNPRGIGFAPNGALYVTEAGNGGQASPCLPSPPQPTVNRCYGETGAVTRIKPDGGFERILTGLPSMGLPNGTAEGGAVDLSFLGTAMYVQLGWGGDPSLRAQLGGKSALFGSMLHVTPAGTYKAVADVAAHEGKFNPSGGAVDSNPYGTLAQPGRRIVADAGANALIEVLANGRTRTFAVLPMIPAPPFPREPVPTSVAEGPDGALYVGQLTGFPFSANASSVLRVSSDGSQITTFAAGFTTVVDVTFDAGGALYVLEVAKGQVGPLPPNFVLGDGRLKRKCPGGGIETLASGLFFPGGVAIGPDWAAYLTNNGTSATDGEVLRLSLTPCPEIAWEAPRMRLTGGRVRGALVLRRPAAQRNWLSLLPRRLYGPVAC